MTNVQSIGAHTLHAGEIRCISFFSFFLSGVLEAVNSSEAIC